MLNKKALTGVLATMVVGLSSVSSSHAGLIVSGESHGLSWKAQSLLVGAADGGTATFPPFEPFGNAIYHPTFPTYSGVVGMLMNTTQGNFVCSGTLMEDRRSILTAAHCVSDGAGTPNPISTTVFFQPEDGLGPEVSIYTAPPEVVAVEVTDYFVHEDYTGEVIDQNDIAVLRLSEEAPDWAVSYGIYENNDIAGQNFNVAGYGRLGDGAGSIPATGRLRQGNNRYDYAFGDAAFGGFFTNGFFGSADVEFSYISDFDNGSIFNDQAGIIADIFGLDAFDVGLGESEVGVAGGDSGGPNFINGLISGVNSYGLTFGTGLGDIDDELNNTFGELSGFVPTYIHADFIRAALVPAPSAFALLGLGLLAVVSATRRQRRS
ncbi:trypsin-like serine protease [Agaribacter flavus]|uniref:Trypsin-like serine protease n=1 Tax=Agaribacter flavus TaxID=1902781 RepID=A0ABV7FVX7_9ALTE